ncbi:DUF3109 family protein [Cytophagaceae bacterium ABcell3]|nr:DUF3109 family protein [Cytophagaceae bacterium ABcell3]
MIVIDNTIISEDIAEQMFLCDLKKCKGACCIEGDSGAPLEISELDTLEKNYSKIKPYLMPEGIKAIEEQGLYVKDGFDDEFVTPTIGGRECAYVTYENGMLQCGIEKAWKDGKIKFQKPISCHLYPIRISKYDHYEALNYDRWYICNDACRNGMENGVEIYKFTKDALIRKYGEDWYKQLVYKIENEK